jgi:hypothetical protein|tara:strand:- start:874 stop:1143 length:270 start_codon:yes stop_codon:yes gene_type:complete
VFAISKHKKGEINMRSLMLTAALLLVACGDKEEEDTAVLDVEEPAGEASEEEGEEGESSETEEETEEETSEETEEETEEGSEEEGGGEE